MKNAPHLYKFLKNCKLVFKQGRLNWKIFIALFGLHIFCDANSERFCLDGNGEYKKVKCQSKKPQKPSHVPLVFFLVVVVFPCLYGLEPEQMVILNVPDFYTFFHFGPLLIQCVPPQIPCQRYFGIFSGILRSVTRPIKSQFPFSSSCLR